MPAAAGELPDRDRPTLGRALARLWPVVVLIALVGLAASLFVASQRTAEYEATASLLLSPLPQGDETFLGTSLLRESGDATTTTQTASILFESREVAQRAVRDLGAAATADEVLASVDVRPVTNSRVIDVAATSTDAQRAARLANTYADAIVQTRRDAAIPVLEQRLEASREARDRVTPEDYSQRDRLNREISLLEQALDAGDPTISLAAPATVPATPSTTPTWAIGLLGLAAGSIAGVFLALALAALRFRPLARGSGALPVADDEDRARPAAEGPDRRRLSGTKRTA